MASFSKLGGHLRAGTLEGAQWAQNTPTTKALDNAGLLDFAPQGALTIFRKYFPTQSLAADPIATVDQIIGALGGRHPTYIELYNETCQSLNDCLAPYTAWIRASTAHANARGYAVAGFSFSTGNPQPSDWAYLQSQGFAGVQAVAMHEYWGNQGFTIYNALRHRLLWQNGDPPVVITETGRDAVEGGRAGWEANGLSDAQFFGECQGFDGEIVQDSYVQGANLFTNGGCPDFCPFEIDGLAQFLVSGGGGCQSPADCPNPNTPCVNGICGCISDADCGQIGGGLSCCPDQTCLPAGTCPTSGGGIDAVTVAALVGLGLIGAGVAVAAQHRAVQRHLRTI